MGCYGSISRILGVTNMKAPHRAAVPIFGHQWQNRYYAQMLAMMEREQEIL